MIDRVNAPSVPADPSADSSPRSSLSAGTSKLSFLSQFRNRSGQAVNEEGSTSIYACHPSFVKSKNTKFPQWNTDNLEHPD